MRNFTKLFLAACLFIGFAFSVNAQSVGINGDGSAPDNSAMLDVRSTDKGLLIPQIALQTVNDITTIANPALSLLVYNTSNGAGLTTGYYYWSGSLWTKLTTAVADGSETIVTAGTNVTVTGTGTTASPYVVNATVNGSGTHCLGEEFLGGIIFNLYTTSNGVQHGLIVSKTEVIALWSEESLLVGADRTEDGAYNMNLMPTGAGTARAWVEALGSGWYLPSIDELSLLFHNRYYVNKTARAVGSTLLTLQYYYSSTEWSESSVYGLFFRDSNTLVLQKAGANVRAVRAF